MVKTGLSELIDPTLALPLSDWLDRVEDIALEFGDFEPLGPTHSAALIEDGPNLLVTFENIHDIRAQATTDVPLGWILSQHRGWSQLCMMSNQQSWFRHRAIYEYFDRLVDDGFFDRYERIVFYGAGACGYAAAAFSVAAPGSTLLLTCPQATQDPAAASWDNRFPTARRMDFTSRYGYAPDMAQAAARVFVLYDPDEPYDAMHAALFSGDHVVRIRCRRMGPQIEPFLRRMNLLEGLVLLAMRDRISAPIIYKALRERRSYLPYLRRLLAAVEGRNRPYLTGLLCRSVLTRTNAPRFGRQLAQAELELARAGKSLPAPGVAALA